MIFHVEAAGEFRPVELRFATEGEVRRVRAWRKLAPSTDAAEFARSRQNAGFITDVREQRSIVSRL